MLNTTSTRDWRELCVAVTNEPDSTKLTSLVEELLEALECAERSWRSPYFSKNPDAGASVSAHVR